MGEICILLRDFWVIIKNYSMRMLSIRGNDFIACWAYEERISAHAQPAVKCEQFLHVQSMLSIRGTNFIAHWAYAELVLSHAEHTGTDFIACLKVEYLGRIEYDFQESRVTGPWDHKVSVSAKKVKTKISCLCTFKPVSRSLSMVSISWIWNQLRHWCWINKTLNFHAIKS